MIIEMRCSCILTGEKFSPNLIPISKLFRIMEKYDLGELITSDVDEGTYSTEGSLILDGEVEDVIEFIEMIYERGINKTISYINICITIQYEDQCNFELSSVQLQKLSSFNVPVGITCYSKS